MAFIQEKPNVKIGVEDEKLAVVLEHVERKDWKFNFAKMVRKIADKWEFFSKTILMIGR